MKKQKQEQKLPSEMMTVAWVITLAGVAPMLDATMMNVAIKSLTYTFSSTLLTVQWGMTGYILMLAIATPISGWLIDRFDGKKVLICIVFGFGVTSVLAGMSFDIQFFIGCRLLQGFCAGLIMPIMSTLLVKIAGPQNIARVIAIVTTPMIFGPIFGPVLGGIIIHYSSWHWLFFINVFITGITVALLCKYLPSFNPFNPDKKLDIVGIILLGGMSFALVLGMSRVVATKSLGLNIWPLVGIFLVIGYVMYDIKLSHQTVLPLSLFHHRYFSAASLGLVFANAAIMGPMLILALFFQNMLHLSMIQSALALIPQGLGMLITRPLIGRMIAHMGAKRVVLFSIIISIIGSIPLVLITAESNVFWLAISLFIRGLSIGGIMVPLSSDAYTGLSDNELPAAGAGITMIENLGSSFGTALVAMITESMLLKSDLVLSFHMVFLVSMIMLVGISFPALYLTSKAN